MVDAIRKIIPFLARILQLFISSEDGNSTQQCLASLIMLILIVKLLSLFSRSLVSQSEIFLFAPLSRPSPVFGRGRQREDPQMRQKRVVNWDVLIVAQISVLTVC